MSILQFYILPIILCTFSNSLPRKNLAHLYRLPKTLWPEEYDLNITLENDAFKTLKFGGELHVTFKPKSDTKEIKIHADKLFKFSSIQLFQDTTQIPLENNKFNVNGDSEILILQPSNRLIRGKRYQLKFQYIGELRGDDVNGFYKSYYYENGQSKYLATTQFQATFARRAFPCFDEPMYKATFLICIKHPANLTALGNTPVLSKNTTDGMTTTCFEKTPKMSTYLVAFVISEYTCEQSVTDKIDVPLRVCSSEVEAHLRKLALDVGPRLLKTLEDVTNVAYSFGGFKKLDNIPIPDFESEAMENWGLVTYKEKTLLYDESNSPLSFKQEVIVTMAHEFAHMWFGNLVTTHWWSDTFLNEGFANYFEYYITGQVEPSFEMEKKFVVESLQMILSGDSLSNTEPLSMEVSTPYDVNDRFGAISYLKGGCIIRMMVSFMGMQNFQRGIYDYLTENAFGNAQVRDLWRSLSKYASKANLPASFSTVMNNWVNKPGYPVLRVVDSGADIIIYQKRFFTDGETPKKNEKWYVPISYTLSRNWNKFKSTLPKYWLRPNKNKLTISNILTSNDGDEWILLNNQQTGYYRVSYNEVLMTRIVKALNKPNFDGITDMQRAYLVDDFYNFALAGSRTYSEFLEFITFIKKDTSYYSWSATITSYRDMLNRIDDDFLRQKLSNYYSDLIDNFYMKLPFHNISKTGHQALIAKTVFSVTSACHVGIQDCIEKSVRLFNDYRTTGRKPDRNLRFAVYCNGLRHSKDVSKDWDFLWKEYKKVKLASEQLTILKALGCAQDMDILSKYLNMSIDPTSGIRKHDTLTVFKAVYNGNPIGVNAAAEFFYKNHEKIAKSYTPTHIRSTLFRGLTSQFTRQEQINELKQFVFGQQGRRNEELENVAIESLQNSEANLKITKRIEGELKKFFEDGGTIRSLNSNFTFRTTTTQSLTDSSSSLNSNIVTFAAILFVTLHNILIVNL